MVGQTEERRRYPRIDVRILNIEMLLKPFSGAPIELFPKDIGLGGISFETDAVLKKEDKLEVTLSFPNNPIVEKAVIEVVWTYLSDRRNKTGRVVYDVGVSFVDLSEACAKEIRSQIKKTLTSKRKKNQKK